MKSILISIKNSKVFYIALFGIFISCTGKHSLQTLELNNSSKASAQQVFKIEKILDFGYKESRVFILDDKSRKLYVSFGANKNDILYVWDIDKRQLVDKYHIGKNYWIDRASLSPSGNHLFIGCYSMRNAFEKDQYKTLLIDTTGKKKPININFNERSYFQEFNNEGTIFWPDRSSYKAYDLNGNLVEDAVREKKHIENRSFWESETRVEGSKLYFRDTQGIDHFLTNNFWHNSRCITKDNKYIIVITWDGELIIWDTSDYKKVFYYKLSDQYGNLAYDSKLNRVLIGNVVYNGSTFLRSLQILEQNN